MVFIIGRRLIFLTETLISFRDKKKKKQKISMKYTAMELYRKKIILEVEGVEVNKYVVFKKV